MSQPPPAPPRPPHAPQGHGSHRIVREPDDRKIAGVCSGLADYLGVDVTVMRVAAVALAFITPAALIAYLVASVAVPERRPDEPRVRARRVHLGKIPHPVIVIGAVVAVAAIVDDAWWLNPFPAAVALVGLGVWLIVQGRDEGDQAAWPGPPASAAPPASADQPHPPAATGVSGPDEQPVDAPTIEHPMASSPWVVTVPQPFDTYGERETTISNESSVTSPTDALESSEGAGPSGESTPPASPWWSGRADPPPPARGPRQSPSRLGAAVFALLLVGGGVLWLIDGLGIAEVPASDALALGLALVGAGLLVATWRGRAYALIPVGCIFAGMLVVGETLDVPLSAGVGDRTEVIDSPGELAEPHELFLGELTVDLTDVPVRPGPPTRVDASLGMGELRVIVPREATVTVDASIRAGEIVSPGGADANDSGVGVDRTFTLDGPAGGPRLELDLSVGLGDVEVSRG
jgi:phage shock protein PspC (stress-responsive transcriptional regulator)